VALPPLAKLAAKARHDDGGASRGGQIEQSLQQSMDRRRNGVQDAAHPPKARSRLG